MPSAKCLSDCSNGDYVRAATTGVFSLLSQSLSDAVPVLCGESARPLRKLRMWLATSMPPIMIVPCFDLRGVPPGERCTLVDFRRELLPIFSASTMEVGVADASADEQRREGIGPDGDSTCLLMCDETRRRDTCNALAHLDFNSVIKFVDDCGDSSASELGFCCGVADEAARGSWLEGILNPKGGGVGGGGGGGGGAAAAVVDFNCGCVT
jgi:hypothetical protein